jgi:hypothetical protein
MPRQERVSTRSLIDKLGVKPEARVTVLGVEDAEFWRQLAARTPDVARGRLRKGSDVIVVAANSQQELAKLSRLKEYLKSNGAIWIVSLKGAQARIKDVQVIAAALQAGLVDNKVVSFSETHTALRLVIPLSRRVQN